MNEKQIVGIVTVAKEYNPDSSDQSGRFGMVNVKALRPFKVPVTLADVKAEPRLENLALVRQSRLSVFPIVDDGWKLICTMGKTKP